MAESSAALLAETSAPKPVDTADVPSSTEATADALRQLLRAYNPAQRGQQPQLDKLGGRFHIRMAEPLPQFDSALAKAYNVVDQDDNEAQLYALICSNAMPARQQAAAKLVGVSHPHLVTLAACGVVPISVLNEERYVLIYEQPKGQKLSELMVDAKTAFNENFILEKMLKPMADALNMMAEKGLSHGRINPDSIYFNGTKLLLAECCSEPCGYSQPFYLEPIERMSCMPAGKGEGDTTQDCYALAVITIMMMGARQWFEALEMNAHYTRLLREGSIAVITSLRDYSDHLRDFFAGALSDNRYERWTTEQLMQWLRGKRHHVIMASFIAEASRPFEFDGVQYVNRVALANAMATHWDKAIPVFRDNAIARWLELSLRKKNVGDSLQRVMRSTGGESSTSAKANNELVARCLAILDMFGPLRMRAIAVNVDGIGAALAESTRLQRNNEIQHIAEIIEHDLANAWAENVRQQKDFEIAESISTQLWLLDKARPLLAIQALGFGVERCLYDLNPSLPCQSPLVARSHVLTLQQLLTALDKAAAEFSAKHNPVDRHIAAFIASRLGLAREVKLRDLEGIPDLANNKSLIAIRLLQMAQEKAGNPVLPGLASWAAMTLLPVLDKIHNRRLRKHFEDAIKHHAEAGELSHILATLLSPHELQRDQEGFQQASRMFQHNQHQIEQWRGGEFRRRQINDMAYSMSIAIAYTALFVMGCIVLRQFFR